MLGPNHPLFRDRMQNEDDPLRLPGRGGGPQTGPWGGDGFLPPMGAPPGARCVDFFLFFGSSEGPARTASTRSDQALASLADGEVASHDPQEAVSVAVSAEEASPITMTFYLRHVADSVLVYRLHLTGVTAFKRIRRHVWLKL